MAVTNSRRVLYAVGAGAESVKHHFLFNLFVFYMVKTKE